MSPQPEHHRQPATGSQHRLFALLFALGLLASLWCLPSAVAAGPDYRFERLGIDDGLSQAGARVVLTDRRGLVWIGTQEGLNRFDGYSIKAFQQEPDNPNSLSDSNIQALHEDAAGILWVGTYTGGLNRYDPMTGRVQRFPYRPDDPSSPSDRWVRAIVSDAPGKLWLATPLGLDRFEDGRFVRYRHDPANPGSLGSDRVRSLLLGQDGTLWVGTEGAGLARLDAASGGFQHFRHQAGVDGSLSEDIVSAIASDGAEGLWIGTESGGLDHFDIRSGLFRSIRPASADADGLRRVPITSLAAEPDGRVWIGTRGGGVAVLDPGTQALDWLRHEPARPNSLSHDMVHALHRDANGLVWVGTQDGLNRFDARTRAFGHHRHRQDDSHSLSHNWVRTFLEDRQGRLWVGTQGGLNRWAAEAGRFERIVRDTAAEQGPGFEHVRALAEHPERGLWVGTDAGLDHYDPESGRFRSIPLEPQRYDLPLRDRVVALLLDHDQGLWVGTQGSGLVQLGSDGRVLQRLRRQVDQADSLSHDDARALHRDRRGRLWVGTWGGGLCRMKDGGQGFHCYRNDPADPTSLPSDVVRAVLENEDGSFWLSTQGAGLVHFDPDTGRSRSLGRRDGLPDDSIYAALRDRQDRLWISSNQGLSRYDPRDGSIRNYTPRDGLQSSEFNTGAFLKLASGELLFGGIGGFNRFLPEQIVDDLRPPPVMFTELLIGNQPVRVDADGQAQAFTLPQPLDAMTTLRLGHRQRDFSIEFAALHFSDPRRNRFAYRLQGFDPDWIATDTRNRRVTYTNLPPGTYTLQVRAANPQGVWNAQGAALTLELLPAPWETHWARALYVLGAILLFFAALRWREARVRQLSDRLKALVDQQTAELQASHAELERASLRDPLTGIGNRRMMVTVLRQAPFPPRQRCALMLLDIDDFKRINDAHGHAAGDAVLVALARTLEHSCRRDDLAVRWGGEEFLLRIAVQDEDDALRCGERLREAVAALRLPLPEGGEMTLTCSIGVACLPFDPATPARLDWERVLVVADQAMYLAKRGGRNAVVCLAPGASFGKDFERRIHGDIEGLLGEGQLRRLPAG
ncbi:MAG: diguanylate cyclase [Aquimonas sp.]|nr:diguanylate cyclase [Aquimonas sp.]